VRPVLRACRDVLWFRRPRDITRLGSTCYALLKCDTLPSETKGQPPPFGPHTRHLVVLLICWDLAPGKKMTDVGSIHVLWARDKSREVPTTATT
jgi:hypothetical protein